MKLSLSRMPEAVAWSVEDLLEKLKLGQVRLPAFQRKLKWDPRDVRQLFDSIIRGIPIGTVLFWMRPASKSPHGRSLELTNTVLENTSGDLLWILDGQQRLTSLAGVLLVKEEPRDDRYRIAFSLTDDELILVPAGSSWPKMSLPLRYVLDSVNLLTWLGDQHPRLDEAAERRAIAIGKAIREYKVPAYIVRSEDEGVARLIFDRTNSTGKRLTKTEVFRALHEGFGAASPDSLDGLKQSIDDLNFGRLPDRLFLNATAAVAGLDVTKMDHKALSSSKLQPAISAAASALRAALVFLTEDAHIPNSAVLPFEFSIVGLTRFFHFYPSPRKRSRELLVRWVWRGAITRMHWAHEQAYVRQTLETMQGDHEESEVQRLLRLIPRGTPQLESSSYDLKSANTRLNLLALLELRPRDLESGDPLDAAALIARFGSKAIQSLVGPSAKGPEENDHLSIFARVIQKPMKYAKLIDLLTRHSNDLDLLGSLGLNLDDVRAIQNQQPFVVQRSQRLTAQFAEFFEQRARWNESDRPSLESMIVRDDP